MPHPGSVSQGVLSCLLVTAVNTLAQSSSYNLQTNITIELMHDIDCFYLSACVYQSGDHD